MDALDSVPIPISNPFNRKDRRELKGEPGPKPEFNHGWTLMGTDSDYFPAQSNLEVAQSAPRNFSVTSDWISRRLRDKRPLPILKPV